MRPTKRKALSALLFALAIGCSVAFGADDPKPKPENTISVHLAQAVNPQKFAQPFTIAISDVMDRSGNPQPMLVYKPRGGIFTDRMPTEILREALENSLKPAGLLASDKETADLTARVYVFKFGLAASSGMDFFGSVEFSVMLKNPKTGATQEVRASGTSIANVAVLKKNIQKNVQENLETALGDALTNFFRGAQLRDAVKTLMKAQENPATGAEHPTDKPGASATQPQSK
ncbi:MAG TPA: hypothetical protein VN025_00620 [Candidatus Dormibacteraeota bacterium]|jgi:hypothetical protein|nr:hypothetical protein [Candidatus Dormibacteraeota bacterium]